MDNKETKKMEEQGIKSAKSMGIPKMLLLGLQHMFAMFGATILVPIIINGYGLPLNIQTTLLFAGLGTLLFHFFTKFKVPAYLGSSFAFLGGFQAVATLEVGKFATMTGEEKLPYALGGIVVAGLMYLVVALIIKVVGVKKVMRFLPPVVTGPIIILIGLILAPSAIDNAKTCWWLALIAFATIVICNIYGKGMIKIIPILMGVVVPYVIALILTVTKVGDFIDFSQISNAGIVGIQKFYVAKFDINAILIMAPIAVATIMEHVGDMSAISATCGENYLADPGLHRSLIGDGLATSVSGMFGGPANTTYGENTGVLALTKVYDPVVVRIAACFAILLSFSPAFAGIIETIPTAIIGGVSFMLYGMISAVGVRNVVENQVDFTKTRNLIISAVILVSGLGFGDGIVFCIGETSITLTGLAVAAIIGIAMNAILPGNDYEFGVNEEGDESGILGKY